ncbi:U8 snoRNA-decapping enzyme isoform X2 [Electrophorus electricus]|uniref:U8 snoRNA-decapping enzyme n=1 Tax=Electrophorus electricus TaxID=8005 RepID=A0AAY5EWL5_ELEEL|nr:U8 snoRNA-decapping enzyme isoform X2 [Electrophorus electricus]
MEGQEITREAALSREDHKHACHLLLYADTGAKLFGKIPIKHIVLMQMRFDGLLGFPGGLVKPSEESLEAGLTRELQEEVGVPVAVTADDYVSSHLAPAPPCLITHFYTKKIEEAELIDIERAAVATAADHGLEVLGMVRVPLYTLRNGGGLPWFLSHSFISNSRAQLLEALQRLGLVPLRALEEAVRQADVRRADQGEPH